MITIKKKVIFRLTAVLLLVLTLLLLYRGNLLHYQLLSDEESVLEVHFIDVGQGDAILIEENDSDMLIDAGINQKGNAVVDYLKSENVTDLKYAIGTHPHADHIGGMDTVLYSVPVDRVILPSGDFHSQTYDDVLDAIQAKHIQETDAKVGNTYQLGEASFSILAPCSTGYSDQNNYSICIKLTYGNTSFLFAGDAEQLSEAEMIKNGENLSADVLKIGHHGSYSSCSEAFLDAVDPSYSVISLGDDNPYGFPHAPTLLKLLEHKISIYRTDLQGTIIFTSDGKKIEVNKKPYQLTKKDLYDTSGTKKDTTYSP